MTEFCKDNYLTVVIVIRITKSIPQGRNVIVFINLLVNSINFYVVKCETFSK